MTSDGTAAAQYTGGHALIDACISLELDTAFGVPGESYLAALDGSYAAGDHFRFIQTRHEAGAANMAEAWGKMTGKPGLCFVTRGPGAAHASIGLHTAFQDSTPMILFVGQVASDQVEREAFQEMDYRRFFSECSKWAAEIPSTDRIGEFIGRAVSTAVAGRPGPVVLALPEDMLSSPAPRPVVRPVTPAIAHPAPDLMARLGELLGNAERPFLLVGGSGWTAKAIATLADTAERLSLPVATSFRAQDRMDNSHPNYIGDLGIGANPKLIARMAAADLIIALGPRLGEMTTDGYRRLTPPIPAQKLIHIHQGPEELGRVYQPDLAILAAPVHAVAALASLPLRPRRPWRDWTISARRDYESWNNPAGETGSKSGPVDLGAFYAILRDKLPADTIATNGAGNYAGWLHRFWRYGAYPSQLAPTSGAMGYGVPAAIAAKLKYPHRMVMCAAGDGCFMMSVQELATAAQQGLAILFVVYNNSQYGTIRMHQERHFKGRISGTALANPDFIHLAESFGFFAAAIHKTDHIEAQLDAALTALREGRSALLEVTISPKTLTPGLTLADL